MNVDFCAYAQNVELQKYPRTPHLEGSRLQPGDSDADQVRYASLIDQWLVVEEKLDGANAGISLSAAGELMLQSRGHYLTGGSRERQFNLFKQWAVAHEDWLIERLEDRFVLYGEWLHKKHSVFYDRLPHFFCEFDVWDRSKCIFLSTPARRQLLQDGPILSVPVLYEGPAPKRLKDLLELVRISKAKSETWHAAFEAVVLREGLDLERSWRQCDKSALMEGLYVKLEGENETTGRLKWVRQDFVQAILDADQHHATQPFIPNLLAQGADIYSPRLSMDWAGLRSGY